MYHHEYDIRVLVHGDDFVVLADDDGHEFVKKALAERYAFKEVGGIGPDDGDGTEFVVLNRLVRFDRKTGSVEYEADPRHVEIMIKQLGLENCKSCKTPNEKKKSADIARALESKLLDPVKSSMYRSLVMRGSYLAQDRMDIAETVKTLARHMVSPNEEDWADLKRLGRFLKGRPRVVLRYLPQRLCRKIRVDSDSDYAGCIRTRRSTHGTVVRLGMHTVKASSGLQPTIGLSVGEAEYYGVVKGTRIGMQMQSMMKDWNISLDLEVYTDSNSAIGTTSRKGLGKMKHVQTWYLWIQERLASGCFKLLKVGTKHNVSDVCTKAVTANEMDKHMKSTGHCYLEGKSMIARSLTS